ncbi:MAG: molybdopterin-dependent oxidoreductase [Rhodospirillaceae bacterium]|nr:molybdopterin-dependent oxidoreductase [Rhodospirillaceae bacterium]
MTPIRCLLMALALFTVMPSGARAIDAPSGPVLLTLSGAISVTNDGDTLKLDQAALDGLPRTIVRTQTPWTEGLVEFEGVAIKDLLALAGAKGQTIQASAINDYAVDVPMSDADNPHVIVAIRMNGALMQVREKGPLWIIYPLTDEPDLETEETKSKMIWQLNRLDIR